MPRIRRTESVAVSTAESEETETEMEESDEDAQTLWDNAEDRVADMVDALKAKLDNISPGIGDRITLAKFCKFVESNSTSLD